MNNDNFNNKFNDKSNDKFNDKDETWIYFLLKLSTDLFLEVWIAALLTPSGDYN